MLPRVNEHGTSSVRNCMVPTTFFSTLSGRLQQHSTEPTHNREPGKELLAANRRGELIGKMLSHRTEVARFVVERTVSFFHSALTDMEWPVA